MSAISVTAVLAALFLSSVSQVSACKANFFECLNYRSCRFIGLKCTEGLHRSAQHVCHQDDAIYERFLWGCAWDLSHHNWSENALYAKGAQDCTECFLEKMVGFEDPAQMCPETPFMTSDMVSYAVENKPCSEQITTCMCNAADNCEAVTKRNGRNIEFVSCVESNEGLPAPMDSEALLPPAVSEPKEDVDICEELHAQDEVMCKADSRCEWTAVSRWSNGCKNSKFKCNKAYTEPAQCDADERCVWTTKSNRCKGVNEVDRSVATMNLFTSAGVRVRWISAFFAIAFVFSRLWTKAPTAKTVPTESNYLLKA